MKTTPNSPGPARLRFVFFALAFLIGAPLERAQTETPVAEAAPQLKVASVAFKFIGIANVSEQIVRANVQMRAGIDYDEGAIDRDIRSLYRTGLFEFIEVKREELPGRQVNLVFEITPKFRIQEVKFDGNKEFEKYRLEKEVSVKPNSSLDEHIIKVDAEKLHDFYQKKGYNQVQVTYSIERDRLNRLWDGDLQDPRGRKGAD